MDPAGERLTREAEEAVYARVYACVRLHEAAERGEALDEATHAASLAAVRLHEAEAQVRSYAVAVGWQPLKSSCKEAVDFRRVAAAAALPSSSPSRRWPSCRCSSPGALDSRQEVTVKLEAAPHPKLRRIDQLNPAEANDEAALRAQLRDLAELHYPGRVADQRRRLDDRRLMIDLVDGEIVYLASDDVDAYLKRHKPRRATLRGQRRMFAADMAARGKSDCAVALMLPRTAGANRTTQTAGRESHRSRPGHRRSSSSSTTSSADPGDPDGEPAGEQLALTGLKHISEPLAVELERIAARLRTRGGVG